jgi:hypothetical protein
MHNGIPGNGVVSPHSHSIQLVFALLLEYCPFGQLVHCFDATSLEKVPGPQTVQSFCPSLEA